jgi:adenosylcobinamide-GDP ribazoletransferase
MDGLADTADGFLSSRPKERMLEIMKDSRTGPMGVLAITGVLLLKAGALSSVVGASRWAVVFLMPFAGRCALVMGMAMLPYARPEGGLVSAFGKPRWAWTAPILLIAISWLSLRNLGLVFAGSSVLAVLVFSLWCKSKVGGFTGDTLGAGCEIAELIPAIIAASWRWPQ